MYKEHLNILVVPDSFKDTATSLEVSQAIENAIFSVWPSAQTVGVPMADGGEGSLDALHAAMGGRWCRHQVQDPLGRSIEARYLLAGQTAYVELAEASGLQLLEPAERSAQATSTFGTGLLMQHALDEGAQEIVLCIGGSATNDAGAGIAHALGYQFIRADGSAYLPVGATLSQLAQVQWPSNKRKPKITVLCDVNNPFTGPDGAVFTYGPQKGAKAPDLEMMENGMLHFRDLIHTQQGINLDDLPGAGAAGGVGGGMVAFFNADLVNGATHLLEALKLREKCQAADLIITGEGRIDGQTKHGKLIAGVVGLAKEYEKPVIAICGAMKLDHRELDDLGLTAAFSIQQDIGDWDLAKQKTTENIETTIRQIIRVIKMLSHG